MGRRWGERSIASLLLFVIANLTGTSVGAIFRAMPVFLGTLLVVLLATTLVPDIALLLPHLLGYQGN